MLNLMLQQMGMDLEDSTGNMKLLLNIALYTLNNFVWSNINFQLLCHLYHYKCIHYN